MRLRHWCFTLVLPLAACSGDPWYDDDDTLSIPEPHEPAEAGEPRPEATVIETVVDAPSGSFRVLLSLPASDRDHGLAIAVPGLGPTTAEWALEPRRRSSLHYLGLGSLTFDLPGSGEEDVLPPQGSPDGTTVSDPVAFGTATRSLVLERVRAAFAWARDQPRVAATGHYVMTNDFGGVEAIQLGDEIGAEAIFWFSPIVQTAEAYLYDELHYRDWLTRRWWADLDRDMTVTPEEWGYYKGSSGLEEDLSFADIDLNGDGVYTREDNELSGAAQMPTMNALLDANDDVGWRAFWGDRAVLFPSTSWADDALDRAAPGDSLEGGTAPIFVFPSPSADTPLEYVDELTMAPGSPRVRLVADDGGTTTGPASLPFDGVSVDLAEYCLLGLVTDPLDVALFELLSDKYDSPCSW